VDPPKSAPTTVFEHNPLIASSKTAVALFALSSFEKSKFNRLATILACVGTGISPICGGNPAADSDTAEYAGEDVSENTAVKKPVRAPWAHSCLNAMRSQNSSAEIVRIGGAVDFRRLGWEEEVDACETGLGLVLGVEEEEVGAEVSSGGVPFVLWRFLDGEADGEGVRSGGREGYDSSATSSARKRVLGSSGKEGTSSAMLGGPSRIEPKGDERSCCPYGWVYNHW